MYKTIFIKNSEVKKERNENLGKIKIQNKLNKIIIKKLTKKINK